MAVIIIAVIVLIGICIAVKLYDEQIRASKYGKAIVVYLTLLAFLTIIVKIVIFLIGG